MIVPLRPLAPTAPDAPKPRRAQADTQTTLTPSSSHATHRQSRTRTFTSDPDQHRLCVCQSLVENDVASEATLNNKSPIIATHFPDGGVPCVSWRNRGFSTYGGPRSSHGWVPVCCGLQDSKFPNVGSKQEPPDDDG